MASETMAQLDTYQVVEWVSRDRHCNPGQAKIATTKARDRYDRVIVQEKLDGSNVGVALHNGVLLAQFQINKRRQEF